MTKALICILSVLSTSVVDGFGIQIQPSTKTFLQHQCQHQSPNRKNATPLHATTPSNRYYQLEEIEDKETATTEIYLKGDGTIELPHLDRTDGPVPKSATGTWKAGLTDNDHTFEMTMEREFSSDVGVVEEGSFMVRRVMRGVWEDVGGAVSITGTLILQDGTMGDVEVGYFSIIDTTDAMLEIMEGDNNKK